MADIFQEVEEDVRRDRALALWRRWGGWAIGAALAVVVGVSAVTFWRQHERTGRAEAGARFSAAAQLAATDPAAAAPLLEAIASSGPQPYATLARMKSAQLKAAAGDSAGAAALYAQSGGAAPQAELREMAALLAALQNFDRAKRAEIEAQLAPLAASGRVYASSARELLALAALRDGDAKAARARLEEIGKDLAAPQALRARAAELLASLGEAGKG